MGRSVSEVGRELRGELLVDIPFDAAAAFIIDVGNPENVRRLVPGRVNPLVRGKERQGRNAERVHSLSLLRCQAALDPLEMARLVAKFLRECGLIEIRKQSGEFFRRIVCVHDLLRVCGKPVDADVGGEQPSVTVDNIGPVLREHGRPGSHCEDGQIVSRRAVMDDPARNDCKGADEKKRQQRLRTPRVFHGPLGAVRAAEPMAKSCQRDHGLLAHPGGSSLSGCFFDQGCDAVFASHRRARSLGGCARTWRHRIPWNELCGCNRLQLERLPRHILDAFRPRQVADLRAHQRQKITFVLERAYELARFGFQRTRFQLEIIGVGEEAHKNSKGQKAKRTHNGLSHASVARISARVP